MRDFEVVAVLEKSVGRALDKDEMDFIIRTAKLGNQDITLLERVSLRKIQVKAWYRTVTAEGVPQAMRAVRKTLGQDAEIIYIELVKEDHLADAQV